MRSTLICSLLIIYISLSNVMAQQSSPLDAGTNHDKLRILLSENWLIDHEDPLFHDQPQTASIVNTFSMGYHSYSGYHSFSMQFSTPTTSPVSTRPTSSPSTRPVSKKPTTVLSRPKTNSPSSVERSLSPSVVPTLRPTEILTNRNATNTTAGIQGNTSTTVPVPNTKLIPYIVSAIAITVMGILSVAALVISRRRRRRNQGLYFSDEDEDDSLGTLSNL